MQQRLRGDKPLIRRGLRPRHLLPQGEKEDRLPLHVRGGHDAPCMLDSRQNILLACALSALAGYVDGIGLLHLGGLFVSFMSGNSTRMAVSLADGQWPAAL